MEPKQFTKISDTKVTYQKSVEIDISELRWEIENLKLQKGFANDAITSQTEIIRKLNESISEKETLLNSIESEFVELKK